MEGKSEDNFEKKSLINLKKILTIHSLLIFTLLLLGNTVRNMKAGLSCPDWPLCYGQLVPRFNTLVYLEFSHRVLAGLVSLLFLAIFVLIFRNQNLKNLRYLLYIGTFLLLAQILMGGLTVLKLLDSYIVAGHLSIGLAFFLTIQYLRFHVSRILDSRKSHSLKVPPSFKLLSILCFVAVYFQSILGGFVASNYAGLACDGFPTCNGTWWPKFEGTVAIHMSHRIGAALVVFLSLLYLGYYIANLKRLWINPNIRFYSRIIFNLVLLQVAAGISNVFLKIPMVLSIAHLALAALLLMCFLRIVFEGQRS